MHLFITVLALTLVGGLLAIIVSILVADQRTRLFNRTVHERKFRDGGEYWEHDLASLRQFEARHGLNPETRHGLRLAIDEWPSWRYLVSIDVLGDGSARGALLAEPYDGKGKPWERAFALDQSNARLLLDSFDHKIEGYWGTSSICTDGTGFQFERWAKKSLSSGSGNAACQKHYAELMSIVAEALAVRLSDAPFDWQPWFWSKRELELNDSY